MASTVTSTVQDPVKLAGDLRRQFIARKAMEFENSAKEIIRGGGAIDQGQLVNSIFTITDEDGFTGISSAEHAPFLEYGTEKHFVPAYSKSGKPVLAGWMRRVLGMSEDEIRAKGGLMVSSPELAFMRRSLAKL